ncbi:hypothetical protein Back2_23750 [Nocardioides baekrokdamisoli]|uniref:Glycosyltransferase RgtA/B/C/D-like domain-containing protein n=1 Tax=Nocardioides baekrokdamisoli TaxID=1804624 RepID=A0A3G9J385_9ACTN|nr:hypothetical protein Back2_23750 [Nocardioides baekrokdamisoli]
MVPNDVLVVGQHGPDCFRFMSQVSAVCVRLVPPGTTVHVTNAGLYPQGFYKVTHQFVSSSVTTTVMWIRGLNIVLALVVFGLAFLVSGRRTRAALALTLGLAMCTPIGLFFIPSTNPTAWSTIGIGSLWVFVVAYMDADVAWRRWTAAGGGFLAWLIAVMARADAPVYAALTVLAAAAIGTERGRLITTKLIMPGALVALSIGAFFAGSGGSVASKGVAPTAAGATQGAPDFILQQIAYNTAHPLHLLLSNIPGLWEYERKLFYTGPLGWGDTPMSEQGFIIPVVLLVIMVTAILRYRGWHRTAYVCLFLAALVIPLAVLQQSHLSVHSGYVQPRYLYPLMLGLLGLGLSAHIGSGRFDRIARNRWVLVLTWAVISGFASLALHIELRRYVSGIDVSDLNLDSHREWWWVDWPLSPMGVWVIGTVAMAVSVGLLLRIALVNARSVEPVLDAYDHSRESSAA